MTCDGEIPRLPDPEHEPMQWLLQFAEALDDIAFGVGNIVSFDPDNERRVFAPLKGGESDDSGTADYWRRFEKRLLHGKSDMERRAIQRTGKELRSGSMTAQDYLRGTCEEILEGWPCTIRRAAALSKEVAGQHIIAGAQDIVEQALACLMPIQREGLALINRWQETFAITEFTNAEMIEELLDEAGVFAEQLRNYDMQMTLGRLVNHINARVEMLRPASKVGDEGAPNGVFGVSASTTDPGMGTRYVFKKEGATWRIVYDGHQTTVEDTKGIRYAHYLLTRKGTVIEALEMERRCNGKKPSDIPQTDETVPFDDGFHAGELDLSRLDRRDFSLVTIKAQKMVWERQLDEETDPSEQADLRDKIGKAEKYISHNENIHGKMRPTGPLENARKRVSNNINRAKKNIMAASEDIGTHFTVFVKARGTAFIYEPDRPIDWIL